MSTDNPARSTRCCIVIFRRHQCWELGWEWHGSESGDSAKEVRARTHKHIGQSIERANWLVPGYMNRRKFKVVRFVHDIADEEPHDSEMTIVLNAINKRFLKGIAQWPNISAHCSDEDAKQARSSMPGGFKTCLDRMTEKQLQEFIK